MGGSDSSGEGTVWIADTGLFVACGRQGNDKYDALRRFVRRRELSLLVPRRVYEELGGAPDRSAPQRTPVDSAIDAGWVKGRRRTRLYEQHRRIRDGRRLDIHRPGIESGRGSRREGGYRTRWYRSIVARSGGYVVRYHCHYGSRCRYRNRESDRSTRVRGTDRIQGRIRTDRGDRVRCRWLSSKPYVRRITPRSGTTRYPF